MKRAITVGSSTCSLLLVFLSTCAQSQRQGQSEAPPLRTLTEQDVMDLMVGSSIQATRNSYTDRMIERAKQILAEGKEIKLISVDDLPDDWNVVSAAGGIGGGGEWEHVSQRMENAPTIASIDARLRAMELLEKHLGITFEAVIRNEASGGTIAALESAAARGLPVVDACLADRCKPEVQIQMPNVKGIGPKPAALVTRWDDEIILNKTFDDYRLEDLGRAVAVASAGSASIARTPMSGAEVKRGTIPGSLSKAILFGRTVREAREQGRDAIEALVKASGGFELFRGIVTKADYEGRRGHSYWNVELEGVKRDEGHRYRVWVKNENIMAWLDGEVDVMPPDLICNLDPETGDAVSGVPLGGYPVGKEVAMVGIPADPMWRVDRGIEIFGPRHFGYDMDYVPVEELYQRNREGIDTP